MGVRLTDGTRVGPYHVHSFLGSGGYGDVYRATDPAGNLVALKQMRTTDPTDAARVRRMEGLVGKASPFVCAIVDVFEHDGLHYLVMEYVDGASLEDTLRREGHLPAERATEIVRCVLQGLQWLHGEGLVHRDIKPGNIILTPDAKDGAVARIIDIDVALHVALERLTVGPFGLGTYQYAPAEVIRGKDMDERADLYSVGVVLFETVTGRLPWPESSVDELIRAVCSESRPSIRDLDPKHPEPLDDYIRRLMGLRPEDRPDSAHQALAELDVLRESLGLDASSAGKRSSMATRTRKPWWGVFARLHLALRVDDGALRGREIDIPKGGVCLGRMSLNPDDRLISRAHCRVRPRRRTLDLRGLRARNGLLTRGGARRRYRARLGPGESVRIGRTSITCIETTTKKGITS